MQFRHHTPNDSQAIVSLFKSVFAKAEGETEGALISRLAEDLLNNTKERDRYCFVALKNGPIVGAIFFSRLRFEQDMEAFILAPVAVHNDYQGQGIGQGLINHGLSELNKKGVSVVLTYGDPAFYGKVGFCSISPDTVIPPVVLSQPQGWLGQTLNGDAIETLSGQCTCVDALQDPAYW